MTEKIARGVSYEVICEFKVLWEGWELDNDGWVARAADGELVVIYTNHGGSVVVDAATGADFIRERLAEHEAVVASMRAALKALGVEENSDGHTD